MKNENLGQELQRMRREMEEEFERKTQPAQSGAWVDRRDYIQKPRPPKKKWKQE